MFNSKNNEKVKIGFRLGGNNNNAKGTVWFSDFKLEEGIVSEDTNWNMVCFIFKNLEVLDQNNQTIKLTMNLSDIETIKLNMSRFKETSKQLSNENMTVSYDIYEIEEPLKSATYSEEYGYYIDPNDIRNIVETYLEKEEYDHIFAVVRLGNDDKNIEIPVNDWIGLRRNGY